MNTLCGPPASFSASATIRSRTGAKLAVQVPVAQRARALPLAIRSSFGSPLKISAPVPRRTKSDGCARALTWKGIPNWPLLVARGNQQVQISPEFKMTSSKVPTLIARIERFPIAGTFTISRGAKTEAVTVVAEISQNGLTGRGMRALSDRKSTRLNSSHANISTLSLHDALPILVARGNQQVQISPEFKMTSSKVPTLIARIERFPIAGTFTISRGAKTEAVTVVAEISQNGLTGRGMRAL